MFYSTFIQLLAAPIDETNCIFMDICKLPVVCVNFVSISFSICLLPLRQCDFRAFSFCLFIVIVIIVTQCIIFCFLRLLFLFLSLALSSLGISLLESFLIFFLDCFQPSCPKILIDETRGRSHLKIAKFTFLSTCKK